MFIWFCVSGGSSCLIPLVRKTLLVCRRTGADGSNNSDVLSNIFQNLLKDAQHTMIEPIIHNKYVFVSNRKNKLD